MKRTAFVVGLVSFSLIVWADGLPTGTWVRRDFKGGSMTLTVEAAGSGRKLTYKIAFPNVPVSYMTILTQLDGKDAPVTVDGKASGETMAIREVDSRHVTGIVKMQGKEISTSKSELSTDGKVLKVENNASGADGKVALTVEYWDKK